MICRTCGVQLSAIRLKAMPNAVQCVKCVEVNGDEPKLRGKMIWDHKTAPYIEIGTRLAAEGEPKVNFASVKDSGESD